MKILNDYTNLFLWYKRDFLDSDVVKVMLEVKYFSATNLKLPFVAAN